MTGRQRNNRQLVLALALAALPAIGLAQQSGDVAHTAHNLSISGPGEIKAEQETEICIFCHASHSGMGVQPLWNRALPSTPFALYKSRPSDPQASPSRGEPDGSSKLCLSCHDGTLALGAVANRRKPIAVRGTIAGRLPPGSRGLIGTDLSGSHPVSFVVDDRMIAQRAARGSSLAPLERMRSDPTVKLDRNDKVQCTSCHNAHDDRNFASSGVHFYNKPRFSDTCRVCHEP